MSKVLDLAVALMAIDTCNPPGNEKQAADFIAAMLDTAGFTVQRQEFAPGRTNLIALKRSSRMAPVLAFTGHLDTVPLGTAEWGRPPFGGKISGGKLYGRGSSDMKAGVAAFVIAAIDMAALDRDTALVITAGEERGCEGALAMARDGIALPEVAGWIVAEPTANKVALGHKGALFSYLHFSGKSAHSSRPDLGVNAIYKACAAALALRDMQFEMSHPVLGAPTVNVGLIEGGHAPNAVPDRAKLHVDVRTIPGMDHSAILQQLETIGGDGVRLERVHDIAPVWTPGDASLIKACRSASEAEGYMTSGELGASFFTDASVLAKLAPAPVAILGPGEPGQAHVTDEWCTVANIEAAERIYCRLIETHGQANS
ncbi:M20 family metallopeptidase [Rhizobium sp. BT-175]|uniref:M20 family metallopeptidase n=1 Tax=Rhizobium sp. BT-175 TaxID=2986929 RepID=UPI0022358451|nr:M20 family metallopeptidase [Rhizobium sp. BT-175]MCV9947589.1 M20 family metallopeptidase [Rhizobium sp. BT-175]